MSSGLNFKQAHNMNVRKDEGLLVVMANFYNEDLSIKEKFERSGFAVIEKDSYYTLEVGETYDGGYTDPVSNFFIDVAEEIAPFVNKGGWIEVENEEGPSRLVYLGEGKIQWVFPEMDWKMDEYTGEILKEDSPVSVLVEWGESEEDKKYKKYTFSSEEEKNAFLLGIDEMDGWLEYEVYEGEDIGREENKLKKEGKRVEPILLLTSVETTSFIPGMEDEENSIDAEYQTMMKI